MNMKKDIWIICCENEYNTNHIFQLVSKANELAEHVNSQVYIVCFGESIDIFLQSLELYGIGNIIFVELQNTSESLCADVIGSVVEKYNPYLIMFPATRFSKSVAARVSIKLNAGLTADCIDIEVENDDFIFVRAAINNAIIASIKCINSKYRLCTVKENVFEIKLKKGNQVAHILKINEYKDLQDNLGKKYILEKKEKEQKSNERLINARIVFGVGRGVSERGFQLMKHAAAKFKAEIVATRNVVEQGLVNKSRQVGQSGIFLAPSIYVCFGVSGASQHIVGIKNAKIIIAVNSDKDAPIFKYADYAIVDDAEKILEQLCNIIAE